ncbi:hypothetical protein F1735_30585 [Massilia sp. CCM 8694]|uniref:Uncharacterized protein n=1 Tax=Massilia genomosp. 1 TaxID=2609280 RepID=A0ABX0N4X8_9BURK|nr:hypothetical protein [Massilia genomosp. 1]
MAAIAAHCISAGAVMLLQRQQEVRQVFGIGVLFHLFLFVLNRQSSGPCTAVNLERFLAYVVDDHEQE